MRDQRALHRSRSPSMGSPRCLPRPWVCKSLELTARARRSSSSAWFLSSRRSICPFSQLGIRWITLFARQDQESFLFSFFHPLLPSSRWQVKGTCSSFSTRLPVPRCVSRGPLKLSKTTGRRKNRSLLCVNYCLVVSRQVGNSIGMLDRATAARKRLIKLALRLRVSKHVPVACSPLW